MEKLLIIVDIFFFCISINPIDSYYICIMKYISVILVFLFFATSAFSQVLNGTFDSFTGSVPNDWTVSPQAQSSQLKDTLTGDPYLKIHIPYVSTDGYNLILLDDTTAAHPYGALLDQKVKKLTFKYKMSSIPLGNSTKVTYLLRDHAGVIYDLNQKILPTYAFWNPIEVDIITKHRDLSGPNYIEIRFTSLTVGIPSGQAPAETEFNFFVDDVALDTNASLAVSKPNSEINSLTISPNPASSQTRITYNHQSTEPVTTIYNIIGREVKRIVL